MKKVFIEAVEGTPQNIDVQEERKQIDVTAVMPNIRFYSDADVVQRCEGYMPPVWEPTFYVLRDQPIPE